LPQLIAATFEVIDCIGVHAESLTACTEAGNARYLLFNHA